MPYPVITSKFHAMPLHVLSMLARILREESLYSQKEGSELPLPERDHDQEGRLRLHEGLSYFERGAQHYGSNWEDR